MRVRVRCALPINRSRVEELSAAFPGLVDNSSYRFACEETDPRLQPLLDMIHGWGWTRYSHGRMGDHEYRLGRFREYSDADLDGLELLQLATTQGNQEITWVPRRQWEELGLPEPEPNYDYPAMTKSMLPRAGVQCTHLSNDFGGIFVHDETRRVLEEGRFGHLVFSAIPLVREFELSGIETVERREYGKTNGPWWLLDSSLRLPPPSDYLFEYDGNKHIYHRPGSHGLPIVEKGWSDLEWRYRRSDIAPLMPFDVARTHSTVRIAKIIVSPRFREFCRERGLQFVFRPVRIDEA